MRKYRVECDVRRGLGCGSDGDGVLRSVGGSRFADERWTKRVEMVESL